ncbi:DUF4132 domain-containing protein [Nocardia sp. CC201C]|uniref:DUF4132 domain-containing protein n=1 Tax=Nocardia sp. CC201C TaxID=3044575 RepID=UPI0024A8CEF2|nr:DUF4132 domain-containing protein [Nocardia sp. CC201C]
MTHLRRADEDQWVVPDAWHAKATPFRGRGPVRAVRTDPKALGLYRKWLDDKRVRLAIELTSRGGYRDLAEAAAHAIEHPGDATPLGIAVAGALAARVADATRPKPNLTGRLVDAWVAAHGAGTAAAAGALLAGLSVGHIGADLTRCVARRPERPHVFDEPAATLLPRLRTHLAALSDTEYYAAVADLGRVRAESRALAVHTATSYLAPTEQDWVNSDLALARSASHPDSAETMLAATVTSAEQLALLDTPGYLWRLTGRADILRAVIEVGPDATPYLTQLLDVYGLSADDQRGIAELLAQLPTDAALLALLHRTDRPGVRAAAVEATYRFPRRAAHVLADLPDEPFTVGLRDLLTRVYPGLNAGTHAPQSAVECVPRDELPELLRMPPWERGVAPAPPTVLPGLGSPRPLALSWLPGEQDGWSNTFVAQTDPGRDWEDEFQRVRDRKWHGSWWTLRLIATAPPPLALANLDLIEPTELWDAVDPLRRILVRCGDAALTTIVDAVRHNAATTISVLLPATGTPVAELMTRQLDSRRNRAVALSWFERHLPTAAPDLLTAAFDKPGRQRTLAWKALRALDGRGHREALVTAAHTLGESAAEALVAALSTDPLDILPKTVPTLPTWLAPAALPPIVLRREVLTRPDGPRALPPDAVAAVCTMLAMSGPTGDYAGVTRLLELAERDSLAEFCWALFELWGFTGYSADENWVLHALGLLGTDDTARALTPLIRAWPGENAHARAVAALDVLTAIGSDVALMQLNSIAEKVKFKGIKATAREKIRQLAEEAGMSAEELADRLVPGFGLAEDGTLRLDYGPRAFLVGFDEQLRPMVRDVAGTPRKALPKPGVKDDPELAPAAYKRFNNLKKDVKSVAAEQLLRMERAMVRNRRWTAANHRRLFVEHPLLWHPTRRLVWATFDADGAPTGSFRVAEDRSLADVDDDTVTLPDDMLVGIAHPLHLGDTRAAWAEVFADYEILQPFPQLQREIHLPTDRDAAFARFDGTVVPAGKVLGLTRLGWERGTPMDAGISGEIFRPLGDDRSVVLDLDPGFVAGMALELGDQTISVHITASGQESAWDHRNRTEHSFADLDQVTVSELLRELVQLTT